MAERGEDRIEKGSHEDGQGKQITSRQSSMNAHRSDPLGSLSQRNTVAQRNQSSTIRRKEVPTTGNLTASADLQRHDENVSKRHTSNGIAAR